MMKLIQADDQRVSKRRKDTRKTKQLSRLSEASRFMHHESLQCLHLLFEGIRFSKDLKHCKGAPDLVVINAIIVDWIRIYKARFLTSFTLHALEYSLQPVDTQSILVGSNLLAIGLSTEVFAGEKVVIATAAIDTRVHQGYLFTGRSRSPRRQCDTSILGATRPSAGTNATTYTLSPFHVHCDRWSTNEFQESGHRVTSSVKARVVNDRH